MHFFLKNKTTAQALMMQGVRGTPLHQSTIKQNQVPNSFS